MSSSPATFLRGANPVRVLLVDDHRAIVEMITQVIETLPGFQVVGAAGDEAEARALLDRERPDVVVLDLVLPKGSGLAVLRQAQSTHPRAQVLIFSGNLNLNIVREALAAGALGIIDKSCALADFCRALEQVAAGQPHFGGDAGTLVRELVQQRNRPSAGALQLTAREQAVLRLIAEGFSSKEIAQQLGLSIYTVVNHRAKLMRKTGLHRVAQLSLYAAQIGLVKEPAAPAEGS